MGCCKIDSNNLEKLKKEFKCPNCREDGTFVEIVTVKSLVKEEFQSKIRSDNNYKFCKSPSCKLVYFSEDPANYFLTEELKKKVTQKDGSLDVEVCYCFGHTRQTILTEIQKTGGSSALQDIKTKMKDPGCFCERINPQGACCLGNVSAWIKEASSSTPKNKIDL